MLKDKSMDCFKRSLATLTGGSGAVAALLTDGTLSTSKAADWWVGRTGRLRDTTISAGGASSPWNLPATDDSCSSRPPTRHRCLLTASSWAKGPGRISRVVWVGITTMFIK